MLIHIMETVEICEMGDSQPSEQENPLLNDYRRASNHSRKGLYPLQFREEQVFWTLVGLPGDTANSLLDEYGNFEPEAQAGSLMPYILQEGQLICALDGTPQQCMVRGYLPLPQVVWQTKSVNLQVEALTRGTDTDSATYLRYTLTNTSREKQTGQLLLLIRPVQINPTWQFGGLSPIEHMAFKPAPEGTEVFINNKRQYISLTPPDLCTVQAFHHGDIMEVVKQRPLTPVHALSMAGDMLSGALVYNFSLPPNATTHVLIAAPLHEKKDDITDFMRPGSTIPALYDNARKKMENFWAALLDTVTIDLPQKEVVHTLKAQIAYILLNQDGPSIQPGSRNYKRAWIRDGSLTSSALLRMGRHTEVRNYLNWYAQQVQPDGWVPPVLQNDGSINTGFGAALEYDSQGEFIYALMEYYRFTKDQSFLATHFDAMVRAMKFLQRTRETTLPDQYMAEEDAQKRFAGILPASFSHEGYAPPKHSYWDDFWALKGWKDGGAAAVLMGHPDIETWALEQYSLLKEALKKSIRHTMDFKAISYIPGCSELGDADPTSTAIAFFPCDEGDVVDEQTMRHTFDLFYQTLTERIEGSWEGDFTPYEIRSILAFVALGQKDRAAALLNYMLTCRRPQGWNHLAEVIYSDPRKGGYIGDMPHTWVGSGYVNSIRGMLVRETAHHLILFSGAPWAWFKEDGITLQNLPTHFGLLDLIASIKDQVLHIEISGEISTAEKLEIAWPLDIPPTAVEVDGKEWTHFDDQRIIVPSATRHILCRLNIAH